MRFHALLVFLALGACAAPEFPDTARAPDFARPGDVALCPDWRHARLSHPVDALERYRNPFPAMETPLGCSLDASIEAQIARPRDLTRPTPRRAPGAGVEAAKVVETFRTEGPTDLRARQQINTGG